MNRQYVIDHDIVGRYLRHELSEAERDEFEIFYLHDPETLDELEALASLQRELASQPGSDSAESSAAFGAPAPTAPEDTSAATQSEAAPSKVVALPERPQRVQAPPPGGMNWLWPLATAAALVVGVAIGLASRQAARISPTLGAATVLHIERMRGSEDPEFVVPANGEAVLLKVSVGTAESTYHVSLTSTDGVALNSEPLRPDAYGEVGVMLLPDQLPQGNYRLQASGADSGELVLAAKLRLGTTAGSSTDQ